MKEDTEMSNLDRVVALESSSSSSSACDTDTTDSDIGEAGAGRGETTLLTKPATKRKRKSILTPSVLSSLDRTKTSDRRAVQIIAPIIHATGQNIEEYNINRSSIRRYRQQHRVKRATMLKSEFNLEKPMVLHWDGKLLEDLIGRSES